MLPVNFEMPEMVAWLKSIAPREDGPIAISELHASTEYEAVAHAVFDGVGRIGEVTIWAKGCVDFQVLTEPEGGLAFFEHIDIERLDDPGLEALRQGFIAAMTALVPPAPLNASSNR